MPKKLKSFTKKRVLVVEGKDEENFFAKLLEHIGIADMVDIRDIEGKDNLKKLIPAYKETRGFKTVEKIAVIRDADNNADDAFKSVSGVMQRNGFKPLRQAGEFSKGKSAVGVFILPDNTAEGMLEDLCLSTVKDQEEMKCVDDFAACIQELKEGPGNIAKARSQAFLATKPDIANSVGVGAQKGYWNFEAGNLQPLIAFLKNLE